MSKIKVLYIIDTIESITAGTERQLIQLIEKLDREKFEPHLLALRGSDFLASNKITCPVDIIGMKSVLSWSGFSALGAIKISISDNNFQIVQTQFPDSNVVGILAAKMAGCRAIISTRRNTGFFYNRRILLATKFANRYVTHFLANSDQVVKAAVELEKIPVSRTSVIYNGLDQERFKLDRQEFDRARAVMNVGQNCRLVGIVANHRPVKDLPSFIRAAEIVANRRKNVKFVIIGSGENGYSNGLKKMVEDAGLTDRICFAGSMENPLPYIGNFDIGVLTSTSEGLSNTLTEYGALGIPSVATRTGGNPEVIRDNSTGILVPIKQPERTAEAIIRLLDDDDLRLKMGREALRQVWTKFSLQLSVKMYQALYTKLYDQATGGKK